MEKKRRLNPLDSASITRLDQLPKMEKKRRLNSPDSVPMTRFDQLPKMENKRCLNSPDSVLMTRFDQLLKMEKKRRLNSQDSVPFDQLPDDLLVLILSKLTIKEAARTSVLSHRWENLWLYYAGVFNFDNADATFNSRRLSIERLRFINWVNNLLNLLKGSIVDEFRVCFDLDASYANDIERWIKFAMEEKEVSRFELDFSEFHGFNNNELYRFPSKLLDSPNNNIFRSFGSLTSLRLASVDLSDEVIAHLIPNCQSLEHLSIKRAASLTYLDATTALKLKHLEIEYCFCLKNVDISNTNIESLKFNGEWETRSSLENLHLLTEVSLHDQWCISVVRNGFWHLPISQLQRLELYMGPSVLLGGIKFPERFPTLCNLKHLEVSMVAGHNQNIFCLTSLICASPLLSSFTLKVLYEEPSPYKLYHKLPNSGWRKSEKRIHKCLKVVQFIGWYGYKSDMDLVDYFIKKSVALEKVIIDPELCITSKRSDDLREGIRDRAKLLQNSVPSGIDLVIL